MLDVKIETFAHEFSLTSRERQVLTELVEGNTSSAAIGEALGISENTVRIHVKNINTRVGVNSKAAVLSRFVRHAFS